MRVIPLGVIALVVMFLAAPVALADSYPETVSGNVIKIGMTASLSGRYTTEGTQALCGAKIAIKWYNDQGGVSLGGTRYQLQLIYYNDESTTGNIASLYTKLITQDKVDFLLAPYASDLTLAALPVAEQNGKLILSHGGASDSIVSKGYQYIVQVLSPASMYLATAVELVKEKIPDAKVALIFENAAFSLAAMNGTKAKMKELGLTPIYEATYEPGTTDFSSFIQTAKQKGANVLLGGGHYEDGKALTKQAHDSQWSLKFIALLVAPAVPKFYQELGESIANGVASSSQWSPTAHYTPQVAQQQGLPWAGPTIDEYIKYFTSMCPNLPSPSYHSAEAAASIVYMVEAIKKAYEANGAAAIKDSTLVRQAFNGLHIMTLFGPLKIDPATGKQIGHPMLLLQWQGNNNAIIWPPQYAEAPPLIAPSNWQFGATPTTTTTTTTTAPPTTTTTTTTTPPATGTQTTTQVVTTPAQGGVSAGVIAAIIIVIVIIAAAAYALARR